MKEGGRGRVKRYPRQSLKHLNIYGIIKRESEEIIGGYSENSEETRSQSQTGVKKKKKE